MNFNIGAHGPAQEMAKATGGIGSYKPRSLREQIQDQIAYHGGKIEDLIAAKAALTPDVEKALDALPKLG